MRKKQPNLRRRTFFTPLLMPVLGGAAVLILLGWLYSSISTTTVVLVRHAEKELDAGADPRLTPAGIERAQVLATMFAAAKVDALYASQFRRTNETLAPLSRVSGIATKTVDASDPELLVETILAQHRGGLVLVAGHSNTIPELIKLLADIDIPAVDESDYSGIYVLTLPRWGNPGLLRLNYPDS